MKIPQPRLTAEALARLLQVAKEQELMAVCLALVRGSPRGTVLLEQLQQLRRKIGKRSSWAYLAELLAAVDQLAVKHDAWTVPAQRLEEPVPPLAHLHAAAQVRADEIGSRDRSAYGEVVQRLEDLLRVGGPAATC